MWPNEATIIPSCLRPRLYDVNRGKESMTLQNVIFSTYMYNCTIDTSQLFSPNILHEALVDLGQRAVKLSFELFYN